MKFDVRSNIKDVVKRVGNFQREIPFATALALTQTAIDLKKRQIEEMKQVFSNPVPWTLKSISHRYATKRDLRADVFFKEFGGKGTPAYKYLMPNIKGGPRRAKRHELALRSYGLMGANKFTVPSNATRLNSAGNLTGGYYRQMLSSVQAAGDQNLKKGSQRQKKARTTFFAIKDKGIFERKGKRIAPRLIFIDQPIYKQRYDFYGLSERFTKKNFPINFEKAFKMAVATRRR